MGYYKDFGYDPKNTSLLNIFNVIKLLISYDKQIQKKIEIKEFHVGNKENQYTSIVVLPDGTITSQAPGRDITSNRWLYEGINNFDTKEYTDLFTIISGENNPVLLTNKMIKEIHTNYFNLDKNNLITELYKQNKDLQIENYSKAKIIYSTVEVVKAYKEALGKLNENLRDSGRKELSISNLNKIYIGKGSEKSNLELYNIKETKKSEQSRIL